MKVSYLALVVILGLIVQSTTFAQDPFASNIRPTEPLSPADAQRSFTLPPGFEIQLVAAEPEIQKPLNMAFDERGRLWLTDTTEYPFPVPVDQPGRDTIKVLADTDGDGRADKVTTFADGLNIPLGIYPYSGGVVAFSIPNIWKFVDTDGDGVADRREKLFGPMAFDRDTHGLNNSFRRGFDGWLYACHGFNNVTTVAGTDGHTITMQSGNTYRMRLDGSRIEHFTWGQVNPFGMTLDPLGNLFTADCHSKPIYQLLRGGYYPSFGSPDDGLGFVPPMMDHLHGSTAIAGVAFCDGNNFPPEFRGNMFSGNVMTSRVNRNRLEYHGSTIRAIEQPDFVVTSDPWFRPVDVQIGPDGALYIADFYNRIIGHYEVALDHPGRDRHRGRIWRIVYKGENAATSPAVMPTSLADASLDVLLAALGDPTLTRRNIAANVIVDRVGETAVEPVKQFFLESPDENARSHALWILARLGGEADELLARAAGDESRTVRVHAMKVLAETPMWSQQLHDLAIAGLQDTDAFVERAAADALGQHPHAENVRPLLGLLGRVPDADNHLNYTVRRALRNQLESPGALVALQDSDLRQVDQRPLADVAVAVNSSEAAAYLLQFVSTSESIDRAAAVKYLQHVARYLNAAETPQLVQTVRHRFADDPDLQLQLLISIQTGFEQRGTAATGELHEWSAELAAQLLDSPTDEARGWINTPIDGSVRQDDPWVLQQRVSADGDRDSAFFCSLPRGEQATGILRSPEFTIPATLSFYSAGHIGPPNQTVVAKNFIRLRESGSHRLLIEATPPRNDTAQQIKWDLAEFAGKSGYLEIVDGDEHPAYAWLAVGRFEPTVAALPSRSPRELVEQQIAVAKLCGSLKLTELRPRLAQLLLSRPSDIELRREFADALLTLDPDSRLLALTSIISEAATPAPLRDRICELIAQHDSAAAPETLAELLRILPARVQTTVAQILASDKTGAETLLQLAEQGHASPRLLLDAAVRARLDALKLDGLDQRITALTAGLPSAGEEVRDLIVARQAAFGRTRSSLEHGAEVFAKNCAACHQVDGKGAVVGPQLDGIGNRGVERLIEDVLDPNRNVDVAFRSTTIVTDDGRVISGLVRGEEGATLVLIDNKGQQLTIATDRIEEQTKTNLSLMPENVAQTLPEQDLFDLLAYLLTKRAAPALEPAP